MNELRRKIVLSAPLMTAGFLTGCGGGNEGPGSEAAGQSDGGRLTVQAVGNGGNTNESLLLTSSVSGTALDAAWRNTSVGGGGANLVPSAKPSIQAVVNGNSLYLCIVEQVDLSSTVKIIRSLTMALKGTAVPAANASYVVDGTTSTANINVLKRTTNANGSFTDEAYAYQAQGAGTVKIGSISSDKKYSLTFDKVAFKAVGVPITGINLASTPFTLSGVTTPVAATQTVAWM